MSEAILLERLGGEEVIAQVVAEFYQYALADERFNFFWLQNVSDIPKLHETFTQYIVGRCGGPKNYRGKNMKQLHKDMPIKESHFAMFWEHMTRVLTQFKVSEKLIQELKQVLFEDKKDIVNTPE